MKKITLKKGINLYLIPDKKFKTYYAGIYIHTPLSEENATKNALIPLLLKRGSKNYPTKADISHKLDMLMGASFSSHIQKRGDSQLISFCISGVSDAFSPFSNSFGEGMELLKDIAFNPLFPFKEDYLESEKKHLSELIESERNDKRLYASLRCSAEMHKDSVYSVPGYGYADEIEKINGADLENHYKSIIAQSPIDIIIAGSFDEDCAKKSGMDIALGLSERDEEYPETTPSAKGELNLVEEAMAVSQGKLCIGFCAPTSVSYAKMMVYNSVFGGGAHSKLFANVREKLSLAYYASSSYNSLKGFIMVSSGIETKNFYKAKEEIFLQYEAMCKGEITENELMVAKKSIINSIVSASDSVSALANLSLANILRKDTRDSDALIEEINNVTVEDLVNVGKEVTPKTVYFLKGAER